MPVAIQSFHAIADPTPTYDLTYPSTVVGPTCKVPQPTSSRASEAFHASAKNLATSVERTYHDYKPEPSQKAPTRLIDWLENMAIWRKEMDRGIIID